MLCLVAQSCLTLWDPMDCSPPGSSVHGGSPGKNTRVSCHALLQEIFPPQGSNPGSLHCRGILNQLNCQGRSRITIWFSSSMSEYISKILIVKSRVWRDMCTPWLRCKESACNARDLGSIPGLGWNPGVGNGNPIQYSCLKNSMDRGAWWAKVHGVTKSQTWLSN